MTVFTTFLVPKKGTVPDFDLGEFENLSDARVWAGDLLRQTHSCRAEIFAEGVQVDALSGDEAAGPVRPRRPHLKLLHVAGKAQSR